MKTKKPKHDFYLNAYEFYKWYGCLTCEGKMKVRKYCLMIHYQESLAVAPRLFSLNKSCKYCPYCDMIVVQKSEIEEHLGAMLAQMKVKFISENYFIFGTIDKKDWLNAQKVPTMPNEMLALSYPFKKIHDFGIQPAGWYKDE